MIKKKKRMWLLLDIDALLKFNVTLLFQGRELVFQIDVYLNVAWCVSFYGDNIIQIEKACMSDVWCAAIASSNLFLFNWTEQGDKY